MLDKNGIEYGECMVGNIIGNHIWGEKKKLKAEQSILGREQKCIASLYTAAWGMNM